MLRVQGLGKRWGRQWAVRELTFRVDPGEILGMVGPNGAGKTTTLRMLATLLPPDAGRAWVGDAELGQRPDRVRRRTGYMPETFGVYEGIRVREYLAFYAECHGLAPRPAVRRAADLLELVGLDPAAGRDAAQLSRGLQQRLSLARALVHDPDLLILDEPAAGLDPRSRVEMRELLRAVARMGKAVLLSSHVLAEVAELCTHVGILDGGRLLLHGPVAAVLARAGGRVFRVRLLEAVDLAVRVLQEQPEVAGVTATEAGVELRLQGDGAAPARVLAALVREGVPVLAFSEARDRLEEVFLDVTAGGEGRGDQPDLA